MKGEAACGTLCQHPECWRADLRRVREAVRARNGIYTRKEDESRRNVGKSDSVQSVDGSLPTLKVIDVFGGVDLHAPLGVHQRSHSLPSLSPTARYSKSSSCSPTLYTPQPSPATPAAQTNYQKHMLWKKQLSVAEDAVCPESNSGHGCVNKVGVHEIFSEAELQQDWQDVYITSAYLVWCPATKSKKRRKHSRTYSSDSNESKKVVPKDMTEVMVPAAMETLKPQRPRQSKAPTGGQPYSPSWTPHRNLHVEQLELSREFVTKVQLAQETDEVHPQFQSSPRAAEPAKKKELSPEELLDMGSRVLLDVDIKSRFTTPEEDERLRSLEEHTRITDSYKLSDAQSNTPPPEYNSIKEADDKLASKQSRVPLFLSSIGIPAEDLPPLNLHHCPNSIPRNLQLGASLEPVDLVPVTPSPAATPQETSIPQTPSHKTTRPHSSLCVNIPSERDSVSDNPLYEYFPIRGHMTSALRFSPNPISAPAPTPISPERPYDLYQRQHSRTSQSRERRKLSSSSMRRNSEQDSESAWHTRRRGTFSSMYDLEEDVVKSRQPSVPGRHSPVGEEWLPTTGHVFITEDRSAVTRTTPEWTGQGVGEWPEGDILINIMNESNPGNLRSPSPGSKTHIPMDILAEFQGDPYGKKNIKFADLTALAGPMDSNYTVALPEYPSYGAAYTTRVSSPGWRLPRSRTPTQLCETVGRTAPKPLRQPSVDSVPKSLIVKHLPTFLKQRPKSTPPRVSSSGETSVQQVLSEPSLVPATQDSATGQANFTSSSSCEDAGSVPPPPSPELQSASLNQTRLEALSEVEECNSIVASTVGNLNLAVTNGDNTHVDLGDDNDVQENQETLSTDHQEEKVNAMQCEPVVQPASASQQAMSCDTAQAAVPPAEKDPQASEMKISTENDSISSAASRTLDESGRNPPFSYSSEPDLSNNVSQPRSGSFERAPHEVCTSELDQDLSQYTPDPSQSPTPPNELHQPPGSPELDLVTCDFSEGLELNLDLGMELQAAMEGLDDMEIDTTEDLPEL